MNKKYIIGSIETKIGKIHQVSSSLKFSDLMGTLKVRSNISRMKYTIEPGIYAVGNPNEDSNVFVSANYKLSFDALRKELEGIDAWILVIDTKGINVWCAAGKGTFGTNELVKRIKETKLQELVSHRKLILPQLGAPGIEAHKIKKSSGFRVIYGPVRAKDIPSFLKNDLKPQKGMRDVKFNFYDRLILTPVEFVYGLKYVIFTISLFFILSFLKNGVYTLSHSLESGAFTTINLTLAYLGGVVLGPVLLPILPGRSFAVKGLFSGIIVMVPIYLFALFSNSLELISWGLITIAISSFLTMNFTGSSTYTSLSGVLKEMKVAIPFQIGGASLGLVLWITSRFI